MGLKIVVGLGSIDDYEAYAEAGADEMFCGYVPAEYCHRFGRQYPVNRREVIYYNVQIGSESELLILGKMIEKIKVPVTIAFNALQYGVDERAYIAKTVEKCIKIGFTNYIVAEPELIDMLSKIEGCRITISGELGEFNEGVLAHVCNEHAARVIFPRQTTIEEMKKLIKVQKDAFYSMEYEAFALNEKCHFTGAYCNSVHCDELCHSCKVPYRFAGVDDEIVDINACDEADDSACNCADGSACNSACNSADDSTCDSEIDSEMDLPGSTGCALCRLWAMREAGVTHLKLVSRGKSAENTIEDIMVLRKAIDILETSESEADFIESIMIKIFPNGCSGNCYGTAYCKR